MNNARNSVVLTAEALDEIEALIAACESELIGDACRDEPDHAPVACALYAGEATPADSLTFGMIRRARAALVALKRDDLRAIGDPFHLPPQPAQRSLVDAHFASTS